METFLSAESLPAARAAAGAVIAAVRLVLSGRHRNAFAAVRPPGHHAGRHGAALGADSQGFCLLNHVAIGARFALLAHAGIERVAIIDFDVHHGNGRRSSSRTTRRSSSRRCTSTTARDQPLLPGVVGRLRARRRRRDVRQVRRVGRAAAAAR